MPSRLRLFLLAGEASGDRLGADLVRRLRQRVELEPSGVGGPELEAEGLVSLFPMRDLSVMGWSDVIRRLPLLLWRVRQTANAILRQRPDVAVLIDSQVFVKAVAARVRKRAPDQAMILYVAPTVWAWRPERAAAIKPLFDEILAILPFERQVMANLGGPPTTFVGHPAVTKIATRSMQPAKGPLLLLPGSREGEVTRHLAVMRQAAEEFRTHNRITGFVIPTLPHLVPHLREATAAWPVQVEIVTGDARQAAFDRAYAAFAVSGTITLELALTGVPMAVTYVADPHQAKRYKKLGRTLEIALPSIILGRPAVPELQFVDEHAPRSLAALRQLLDDPAQVAAQREAFLELRRLMLQGAPDAPLVDPAERVLALAQRPLIGS
jgi:lipid-A-disaccharide synthase